MGRLRRWRDARTTRLEADAQRLFQAALDLEASDIGHEDTEAIEVMRRSAMRKQRQARAWWTRVLR
ncbi:MAG: hypothetical protein AAGA99_22425 [Actinomycetota bacterium]